MDDTPSDALVIPRRTFEALFHPTTVQRDAALDAGLREVGVDLAHLEASYSLKALRAAQEVLRLHAFSALPVDEGYRAVGRAFVAGFRHTPVGWVFRSMAPMFGADRTIQTMPRYLSSVREDMPLVVAVTGERRYQMTCADPGANPHFLAGCLEVVLETCGVTGGAVAVARAGDDGFTLEVSW